MIAQTVHFTYNEGTKHSGVIMSYSVLIVDDDERIRDGLLQHIEWDKLECDPPLLASGGKEALEILKHHKIDIMITDIRMPEMSGLELCEIVTESHCNTIIVILSGYSDFEYAKAAMKYGIKYYMTKPTDPDLLSNVLNEIKNRLMAIRKNALRMKDFEKKYNHAVNLLIEQFFIDLANGAIKSALNISEFITEYDITFHFAYFNIISIRLADHNLNTAATPPFDAMQYALSIENIIQLTMDDAHLVHYVFKTAKDIFNIIVNYDDYNDINLVSNKLYENINSFTGLKPSIDISKSVTGIEHINYCYNQIVEMHDKFIPGSTFGVFSYKPEKVSINYDYHYPKEKEMLLLSYISNNDCVKALNIIDSIFLPLIENNVYKETYLEYFAKLYFAIESSLGFFNVDIKDVIGMRIYPLKRAAEFSNLNDLILWLKDFVIKVANYINNNSVPFASKIVVKIKEYLENNYMKDITLFTTSEEIHLSPAYISKIFKKVTGSNFIDYITTIRMNKAKTILKDMDIKIGEICSLVGYRSAKHFFHVFKSYTGMTPTEYRKSINQQRM